MTENKDDWVQELNAALNATVNVEVPEYRVYYNDGGRVTFYTTDKLPGNYIVISAMQYAESRHDARVENGKLIFTHTQEYTFKLHKTYENCSGSYPTTKYDVNIIVEDSETPRDWWSQHPYILI